MKIKDEEKLLSLLDEKLEKLAQYKKITEAVVDRNIEDMAQLIADRQMLIKDIEKINDEIRQNVDKQKTELGSALKSILGYEHTVSNNMYKKVSERADALENMLISISAGEKEIKIHIDNIKREMVNDIKKSVNSKKIIDFYNTAVGKQFSGTTFNTLN